MYTCTVHHVPELDGPIHIYDMNCSQYRRDQCWDTATQHAGHYATTAPGTQGWQARGPAQICVRRSVELEVEPIRIHVRDVSIKPVAAALDYKLAVYDS